jgi:Sap, sulfolipid-1-addressing protein
MANVISSLLPLIIGAAVLPLWLVMTLIMLRGQGGLPKAAAFVAGAMAVRVLQFMLFGRVFGAIVSTGGEDVFALIPSTLLLVAGLLLLITVVKTLWWPKDDDSDAPPPRWLAAIGEVSTLRAFGIGALMMAIAFKCWVFTLSAIAVIDEADLGKVASIFAYAFFILTAQSLMLAPIIYSAVAPERSAKMVAVTLGWLERNSRVVTLVVSLVFGVWFLARGMSGFIDYGRANTMHTMW